VDTALSDLTSQIDLATQRLLDDARTLTEDDLRVPSLLPGWTRAHVLAHLARDADALRGVLAAVRSGQDRPAYASAQAREAAIETGAAQRAADLTADVADSARALRFVIKQLPDEAWLVPVRVLDPAPFPAAGVLTWRLTEVELHHSDLATGYRPADWPAAFAALDLPGPLRSQRQERIARPGPAADKVTRTPARPVPPYNPGQRLPGSWIGQGGRR
jgi:maleylpyruvate isomerase